MPIAVPILIELMNQRIREYEAMLSRTKARGRSQRVAAFRAGMLTLLMDLRDHGVIPPADVVEILNKTRP